MRLWLDAHLSPALCVWLRSSFALEAVAVRDLGLAGAEDPEIFERARAQTDVVMTKDRDFVDLLSRLGPPPKVIWITVGNTSNQNLKRILSATLQEALTILEASEVLVEISEAR